MSSFTKGWSLFNSRAKWEYCCLFVLEIIGSLLELVGVSMFLPFMQLLLTPEKLDSNKWIHAVIVHFHLEDKSVLMIVIIIAMIFVFVTKNLFMIFILYYRQKTVCKNQLLMEKRVFNIFLYSPYLEQIKQNPAVSQRIILADISGLFETLTSAFILFAELLSSTFLFTFLLLTDWISTITVAFILVVFLLLYYKVFKKRLYSYGKISQQEGGEVLRCINKIFYCSKEIKIYEREHFFSKEFSNHRTLQTNMNKRANFFPAIPRYILEMLATSGMLLVVLFRLLLGGDISEITVQMTVLAVAAFRMLPSATRISTNLSTIVTRRSSVDVVYNILTERRVEHNTLDKQNSSICVTKGKDIVLEDVSFKYNDDKTILDKVNLRIKGSSSIALVGESGGGKTTTVDLILGLFEPSNGSVKYDGVDISKLNSAWSDMIGYIPQNIYLSDDSIRANIAFGIDNPDDDKIWEALRAAQLYDFVKSLPQGLDSTLGEAGACISGGQKQRIGIARALYNDPDILILDEATSALDKNTEDAVMETVNSLHGTRTIIIIAHRLSTIENCDEVYEVKKGSIIKVR